MKVKLKEIKIKKARNIIPDKELVSHIIKTKEPIFEIEKSRLPKKTKNRLLELEIALRRCERVGVFTKK